MFKRICPQCKKELSYSNIKNRNKAEKDKVLCKDCFFENKKYTTLIETKKYNKKELTDEQVEYIKSIWYNESTIEEYINSIKKAKLDAILENKGTSWERNCPNCGDVIIHTNKWNRDRAQRDNQICSKCSHINFGEEHKGEKNPFYGKKHSKESMDQMKETSKNSEKREKYYEGIRSDSHREKLSIQFSGENNPRYGRGSLYDIWLEKYGKEEANERQRVYKERLSLSISGEKNFWFGKTPPQGVGNGWNGWYKEWFFRSLTELAYMINVIEKEGLIWQSAESKEFKITYKDDDGKSKNYFADFIIEGKRMVEVKPTALQGTKVVLIKMKAGIEFCKKNNLTFEIIDPIKLTEEEVMDLYVEGKVTFTEKTKEKFIKKYLKD